MSSFNRKLSYFLRFMPDKIYLKIIYFLKTNTRLNLKRPVLLSEKIQWLKLNDRKKEYISIVDKFECKKYISRLVGSEHVVPTYGVYESFSEIDFNKLPNSFVIKTTHDQGCVIICKDKQNFDFHNARKKIEKALKKNFYYVGREWPYKFVKPRIIIEKLLVCSDRMLDYKFFCFNGDPKLMYISNDGDSHPTTDFFDMNFCKINLKMRDPNSNFNYDKPLYFDEMKAIASKLSRDFKFIRIDMYLIDNIVYVGEMTLYHNSGFFKCTPMEANKELGDLLKLW